MRHGRDRALSWRPARAQIASIATALALAVTGGLLFWWARLPLAWMLGPMLATTIASLGGLAVAVPLAWRNPMIAVLGVLLGSGFTLEMVRGMVAWVPTLAVLPFYVLAIGGLSLLYLRKVAKLDPRTAFFCASPGGLGEMIILGDRAGGDMRTIALVHGTRILLVVFLVPFGFRALGYDLGSGPALGGRLAPSPADLAIMAACALLGSWLGPRLRLPAAPLMGPMLLSAGAHLTELAHGAPPALLINAAQLVIGASVGCQFAGYPLSRVLGTLAISLGLTLSMLTTTVILCFGLHWLVGLPVAQLILGFAPGGLAEMSVMALSLTRDPAFVATHHIARVSLVVLLVPYIYGHYEQRLRRDEKRRSSP